MTVPTGVVLLCNQHVAFLKNAGEVRMGNSQDGSELERGQLCTALQRVLHVRSPPFPLQGHSWPTTGTLSLEAHDSVLQYDFLVRKIGVRVQPSCAFLVIQAPVGCSELHSTCPPTSLLALSQGPTLHQSVSHDCCLALRGQTQARQGLLDNSLRPCTQTE